MKIKCASDKVVSTPYNPKNLNLEFHLDKVSNVKSFATLFPNSIASPQVVHCRWIQEVLINQTQKLLAVGEILVNLKLVVGSRKSEVIQ